MTQYRAARVYKRFPPRAGNPCLNATNESVSFNVRALPWYYGNKSRNIKGHVDFKKKIINIDVIKNYVQGPKYNTYVGGMVPSSKFRVTYHFFGKKSPHLSILYICYQGN